MRFQQQLWEPGEVAWSAVIRPAPPWRRGKRKSRLVLSQLPLFAHGTHGSLRLSPHCMACQTPQRQGKMWMTWLGTAVAADYPHALCCGGPVARRHGGGG